MKTSMSTIVVIFVLILATVVPALADEVPPPVFLPMLYNNGVYETPPPEPTPVPFEQGNCGPREVVDITEPWEAAWSTLDQGNTITWGENVITTTNRALVTSYVTYTLGTTVNTSTCNFLGDVQSVVDREIPALLPADWINIDSEGHVTALHYPAEGTSTPEFTPTYTPEPEPTMTPTPTEVVYQFYDCDRHTVMNPVPGEGAFTTADALTVTVLQTGEVYTTPGKFLLDSYVGYQLSTTINTWSCYRNTDMPTDERNRILGDLGSDGYPIYFITIDEDGQITTEPIWSDPRTPTPTPTATPVP